MRLPKVGPMAERSETLRDVAARAAAPLRFGAVGASGVLVNTLVLWALAHHTQLAVWLAGAVAAEAAIVSNFLLNDRWTFRGCGARGALGRFARFNGVALGGMVIAVALLALLSAAGLDLLVANGAGVGVAAGWNYAASRRWAWGTSAQAQRAERKARTAGPARAQ